MLGNGKSALEDFYRRVQMHTRTEPEEYELAVFSEAQMARASLHETQNGRYPRHDTGGQPISTDCASFAGDKIRSKLSQCCFIKFFRDFGIVATPDTISRAVVPR